MGLLSFFQRKAPPAAKASADMSVQQLRVRARRRLIGAAVLVGLGVIGFPLVFETQPRPIPVDLPIDIPRKETAPALAIPQPLLAPAPLASSAVSAEPAAAPAASAVAAEPGRAEALPKSQGGVPTAALAESRAERAAADKPAAKSHEKPVSKTAVSQPQDGARAQALLDGKPSTGKFVVQVGAYADAKAAHEARMKLERMGLKTYLQTVDTPGGKRIRVRVGPYGSREEADKVAGKVRGSGLSTAVLSL